MSTLRERCEKLRDLIMQSKYPDDVYLILSFAQEIRDEVLEEAAVLFKPPFPGAIITCGDAAKKIRALKSGEKK